MPRISWAGLGECVRGSSEFVPQFEGEGHGNQLSVAVPQQLRPGRFAGGVRATTRRGARSGRPRRRGASAAAARVNGRRWRARATRHRKTAGRPAARAPRARAGPSTGCATPMTILMAMARSSRSAVWCCNSSTLQPDLSTRKYSSMRQRRAYHCRMRMASSALLTRNVVSRNHSSGSAAGGGCSSRTWTTHRVTGSLPRRRAAPPAGSAASRRRPAPRGGPCGPVCWPSRARSAAAPRPLRRFGPARCAPSRTDGARPPARRASFPCPRRGRPWRGPAGRPAEPPRSAR